MKTLIALNLTGAGLALVIGQFTGLGYGLLTLAVSLGLISLYILRIPQA